MLPNIGCGYLSLSLPLSPSRKIMLYFAHQLPPLSSSVTIVSHPTRQLHTTKESTLHLYVRSGMEIKQEVHQ